MTTTIEVHEKTDVILPPRDGGARTASAVSWGAIFAGAAGSAALSLILVLLGSGLGFSSISPWSGEGVSAKTLGISGILWITLTSLAASGLGGYLAGRLRTRWAGRDRDEIYFRDTAHGFLAWAIATLFTAALLTSTISLIITGGVKAGAKVADSVVSSAVAAGANTDRFGVDGDSTGYFIDTLFRRSSTATGTNAPSTFPNDATSDTAPATTAPSGYFAGSTTGANTSNEIPSAEVARIFINAIRNDALPDSDAQYLAQIVAEHTELSQAEAEQRVKDTFNQWQNNLREAETAIKEAADDARKTTAYLSLWFFVALLVGAFTASWLATFGGRQRDL